MRLILDARFWRHETGGIGRYSRELLKELLALNTDDEFHIILTPKDKAEFAISDKRVTPHVTDIGHYSLAEQIQLPGLINSLKPDLVHFLNFNQPLFYFGRRVTTIHDLTVKYFPVGRSQKDPFRRFAFNQIMKHAARSDGVIAISNSTKDDIVRELNVDSSKIHVISEAADSQFKPFTQTEQNTFRKRVGLQEPYILFVNQWRPHKGIFELVKAFSLLKEKHHLPHKLVITGKPSSQFPQIQQAIEQSSVRKDIILPGFLTDQDLPAYYATADVVAFPSYYEGFGLGILEAMQSGTPVVCSKVSSLPEVAGDAALLVEPKNVVQLTDSLLKVLRQPELAADLRRRGLAQAAKFSWKKTAKKTYELYQSVLAK